MQRILFMLIILLAVAVSGQAQDKLKIGEVKNGKLVIIGSNTLNTFFMNSLEKSGTLGKEIQINPSPEGDRFLVYFPVSNNKDNVSCIGVLLVNIKNEVFIVKGNSNKTMSVPGGGFSYEVSCKGEDCMQCVPKIRWIEGEWIPYVECVCTSTGGGICKMETKVIIEINI